MLCGEAITSEKAFDLSDNECKVSLWYSPHLQLLILTCKPLANWLDYCFPMLNNKYQFQKLANGARFVQLR